MLIILSIINTMSANLATGIILALLTVWLGWMQWRKREKLRLSYTIAESDFFPLHDGQGKYYTLKISNYGGKLVKNINSEIIISDAEIDKVSNHELISDLHKETGKVKFFISSLNPSEDVNITITSKVKDISLPIVKIRGEGVNALKEVRSEPSKWDVGGTALIWWFIGFFSLIVYMNVIANEENRDRTDNLFIILNKSGLPHVFQELIESHDDISYQTTAYYLLTSYLKDQSHKDNYLKALKEISNLDGIAKDSKGVAYYLIYKINTKSKNMLEANKFIEKCKEETPDTYKYLIENDDYYNLDSLQLRLK